MIGGMRQELDAVKENEMAIFNENNTIKELNSDL